MTQRIESELYCGESVYLAVIGATVLEEDGFQRFTETPTPHLTLDATITAPVYHIGKATHNTPYVCIVINLLKYIAEHGQMFASKTDLSLKDRIGQHRRLSYIVIGRLTECRKKQKMISSNLATLCVSTAPLMKKTVFLRPETSSTREFLKILTCSPR